MVPQALKDSRKARTLAKREEDSHFHYNETAEMSMGKSRVMDVTFGHRMTERNPSKNDSSCMIKNVNACYQSTHLAGGKGQKKYFKNIVKPEKM